MAAFNKFNPFVEHVMEGVHNFATNQIVVALTADGNAPDASDGVLTDLTEIASYANLSSRNVTTTTSAQSGGLYKLTLTDLVLTNTGAGSTTFRYVVLYNEDAASDNLIGWYDYGSSVTLNQNDTFTIDFDAGNGALQLT